MASSFATFFNKNFPPLPIPEVTSIPSSSYWTQRSRITQMFFIPTEQKIDSDFEVEGLDIEDILIKITVVQGGLYLSWSGINERIKDEEKRLYLILQILRQYVKEVTVAEKIAVSKNLFDKNDWIFNIEEMTGTNITFLSSDIDDMVQITFTGKSQCIENARFQIQIDQEEEAKKFSEELTVDKIYHPFIRGAYKENVDYLQNKFEVKILIPPKDYVSKKITIFGDNFDKVLSAKRHIEIEVSKMEDKYLEVDIQVKKSEHHLVVGSNESGIEEILKKTGVFIEIPSDYFSETIKLIGPKSNIKVAQSIVLKRAKAYSKDIQVYPWIRQFISNLKTCELQEVMGKYIAVLLQFTDETNITILGPEDEVISVDLRLREIINELNRKFKNAKISLDYKYFSHFSPSIIEELESNYEVSMLFPDKKCSIITLVGSKKSIELAKIEISQITKALDESIIKTIVPFKTPLTILERSNIIEEMERNFFVEIKDRGHSVIIEGLPENCREAEEELKEIEQELKEAQNAMELKEIEEIEEDIQRYNHDKSYTISSSDYCSLNEDFYRNCYLQEDDCSYLASSPRNQYQEQHLATSPKNQYQEQHCEVHEEDDCTYLASSPKNQYQEQHLATSPKNQYQEQHYEVPQVQFRRKKKNQRNRAYTNDFSNRFLY